MLAVLVGGAVLVIVVMTVPSVDADGCWMDEFRCRGSAAHVSR
jgi:hypothetical protein